MALESGFPGRGKCAEFKPLILQALLLRQIKRVFSLVSSSFQGTRQKQGRRPAGCEHTNLPDTGVRKKTVYETQVSIKLHVVSLFFHVSSPF